MLQAVGRILIMTCLYHFDTFLLSNSAVVIKHLDEVKTMKN